MLAGAVAVALSTRGGPRPPDLDAHRHAPARPGTDPAVAAAGLVDQLEDRLRRDDRPGVLALADRARPASRRRLAVVARNVRALRITGLTLRYAGRSGVALTGSQAEHFGADAWVADVRVTWRLGGVDPGRSAADVPVVLGWHAGRAVFETALAAGRDQVPLWLVDALVVRRTPDTLVLATDRRDAASAAREAVAAVATVRRTIRSWAGPLVVEVPAGRRQFRVSAAMSASDARAIAAVTTTTDGSASPRTPVHVYLNPPVFDRLGPQGRQIVLSHEATHVALGAATTSMPLWLSEGTADYVALAHSAVPVRTLASQIRQLVRDDGPPATLPGPQQFSASDRDIGAWYEAAWLAARLIATEYGPATLLRFYRASDRAGGTARAFARVLHTTRAAFEREWRAELVALSGA